jgi:hypothetical protein
VRRRQPRPVKEKSKVQGPKSAIGPWPGFFRSLFLTLDFGHWTLDCFCTSLLFTNEDFSCARGETPAQLLWEHSLLGFTGRAIISMLFNLARTRQKTMSNSKSRLIKRTALLLPSVLAIAFAVGCAEEPANTNNSNSNSPATTSTPATAASPSSTTETAPATTASPAIKPAASPAASPAATKGK